jgi:hypothetical protein
MVDEPKPTQPHHRLSLVRSIVGATIGYTIGLAAEWVLRAFVGIDVKQTMVGELAQSVFGGVVTDYMLAFIPAGVGATAPQVFSTTGVVIVAATFTVIGFIIGIAVSGYAGQPVGTAIVESIFGALACLALVLVLLIGGVMLASRLTRDRDWPLSEIEAWTFAGPLFKGELDDEPKYSGPPYLPDYNDDT